MLCVYNLECGTCHSRALIHERFEMPHIPVKVAKHISSLLWAVRHTAPASHVFYQWLLQRVLRTLEARCLYPFTDIHTGPSWGHLSLEPANSGMSHNVQVYRPARDNSKLHSPDNEAKKRPRAHLICRTANWSGTNCCSSRD